MISARMLHRAFMMLCTSEEPRPVLRSTQNHQDLSVGMAFTVHIVSRVCSASVYGTATDGDGFQHRTTLDPL